MPGAHCPLGKPASTRRAAVVAVTFLFLLSGLSAWAASNPGNASAFPSHPQGVGLAATTPQPESLLPAATAASPSTSPHSPHPGTLDIYEVAPAGATSEDPAVAYDYVSYEPILNVYQTLVNYNGSSTSTFVPTVATCVPGTIQCVTDYGTNLTGYVAGQPIYWTFVIDPQAHFYDPSTSTSWPVYPTDVMFSLARTMAFADVPYAGRNPGWLQAQALLENGTATWDAGIHSPYNTSPASILGSMLINDSSYCPAGAITGANGCITFIANGGGTDWPFFLQLVADNLGSSVVPCGWYAYEAAGMPGWGTNTANHPHGDGPCTLPNGATSTNGPGWASYLAGLGPTAWDSFELAALNAPVVDPGVQWNMVGSGPYFGAVSQGVGYVLTSNPAYRQPAGCSGAGGLATYGGYCDPAAGGYIGSANVYWESNDSLGISQYWAGQADLAGIETTHTTTLLQLAAQGKLNYIIYPTLSQFFTSINLYWSATNYATYFPSNQVPTIPGDFFTNLALREFYVHAYPYLQVENTVRTVDGIQFTFNAGGPIPFGMGDNYPTNISFPTGEPDMNPADVGGAAWWWAQAINPSSSYYDPQLSSCTPATPCTWWITGLIGDPSDDVAIADWIGEITALTGGALKPFGGDLGIYGCGFYLCAGAPYQDPFVSQVGFGWSPDYPDPTDYVAPEVGPNAVYTEPDTFSQQVGYGRQSVSNISACGHYGSSFSDLVYWANAAANPASGLLNSTCQGIAYTDAVDWMNVAATSPIGAARTLDYNLIEHITNALAMYVWNGQANALTSAAPWIAGSSINTNVMIGSGGDQPWFQIRYAPFESPVTFQASGLPASSTWSVTAGSPATTKTNTTVGTTGKDIFYEPNGTLTFAVTPPAGYGVALITGPHNPTYTQADITGTTTITVKFGQLNSVYFNETIRPGWPGLPAGTAWNVTLTPSAHGGPPGQFGSTTGTSIVFTVPHGATYRFVVGVPSTYKASPGKGSFTVPPDPVGAGALQKPIHIKPITAKVTFKEKGATSTWSVTISGTTSGTSPYSLPYTLTNTSTSKTTVFDLVSGRYSWVASSDGQPTQSGGAIVVTAPTAPPPVAIVFPPVHAQFGPGPVARLLGTLPGHPDLVANVWARDAG
jgi:hypothetical protein